MTQGTFGRDPVLSHTHRYHQHQRASCPSKTEELSAFHPTAGNPTQEHNLKTNAIAEKSDRSHPETLAGLKSCCSSISAASLRDTGLTKDQQNLCLSYVSCFTH